MALRHSFPRPIRLAVVGGLLLAAANGCSSSRPSPSAADRRSSSPSPSGPALSLLYTTADAELMLRDARRDTAQRLAAGVEFTGPRAVSPTGRYLAFSYATADSSHLALLDLTDAALQRVHAVSGRAVYSLAWHPDQERLAFGHYRPTDSDERGPGGIQVATPSGTTRDLGCRSVREVLHWLPDSSLATRTSDTLYLVGTEDCSTRASRDARRMYHLRYAPEGRRMAYIYRELRYDRSAGDYVPDSSLVVSDARGQNSETLFGDERQVRHLRWGPNGSELAFDMETEDSPHRQIVVYDGNRPIFLVPPPQTTADQVFPRWSPSGERLAFALRTADGLRAAVRLQGQTRRLGPVEGTVWGWLDNRSVVVPGPDSLRIQTLNGTTRYTQPAPTALIYVWTRPVS